MIENYSAFVNLLRLYKVMRVKIKRVFPGKYILVDSKGINITNKYCEIPEMYIDKDGKNPVEVTFLPKERMLTFRPQGKYKIIKVN